jgi:hypothetical protein
MFISKMYSKLKLLHTYSNVIQGVFYKIGVFYQQFLNNQNKLKSPKSIITIDNAGRLKKNIFHHKNTRRRKNTLYYSLFLFFTLFQSSNGFSQQIKIHPTEFFPTADTIYKTFDIPEEVDSMFLVVNFETSSFEMKPYKGEEIMLTNRDFDLDKELAFFKGPFSTPNTPKRERLKGNLVQVLIRYVKDEIESFEVYYLGIGQDKPKGSIVMIQLTNQTVAEMFDPLYGMYSSGVGHWEALSFPNFLGSIYDGASQNFRLGKGSPFFEHYNSLDSSRIMAECVLSINNSEEKGTQLFGTLQMSGGSSLGFEQKSFQFETSKHYYGERKPPLVDLYGEGKEKIKEIQLRNGGNNNSDFFISDALVRKLLPKPFSMNVKLYHVYIGGLYMGVYWFSERFDQDWLAKSFGGDDDEYTLIRTTAERNIAVEANFPGISTQEGKEISNQYNLGTNKFSYLPSKTQGQLTMVGLVKHGDDSLNFGKAYLELKESFHSDIDIENLDSLFDVRMSLKNLIVLDFFGRLSDIGNNNTFVFRRANGKWTFISNDFDNMIGSSGGGSLWRHLETGNTPLHMIWQTAMRDQKHRDMFMRDYQDFLNESAESSKTIPIYEELISEFLPMIQQHRNAWHPNSIPDNWENKYAPTPRYFLENRLETQFATLKLYSKPLEDTLNKSTISYKVNIDWSKIPTECKNSVSVFINTVEQNPIKSWTLRYYNYPTVFVNIQIPPGYDFKGWEGLSKETDFELHLDTIP